MTTPYPPGYRPPNETKPPKETVEQPKKTETTSVDEKNAAGAKGGLFGKKKEDKGKSDNTSKDSKEGKPKEEKKGKDGDVKEDEKKIKFPNFNGVKEAMKIKKSDTSADSDDSDDSPSEDEEDWLLASPPGPESSAVAPSTTAITIRNLPAVSFIDVEEEKAVLKQLKNAKSTKKKYKKTRKIIKKNVKMTQQIGACFDAYLTYLAGIPTENVCIDDSIDKNLKTSLESMHAFRDSGAFTDYTARVEGTMSQMKAVENHASLLATTSKERRVARDKRIKAETAEAVDVADEEQYQKRMEIVNNHKEKDQLYKEEFKSFKEHSSAQLAQSMRSIFLDSAQYLEEVAATLRKCAELDQSNVLATQDLGKKFEKFEDKSSTLKERVQLFTGPISGKGGVLNDRLAVKPQGESKEQPTRGIPMSDKPAEGVVDRAQSDRAIGAKQETPYGTSSYKGNAKREADSTSNGKDAPYGSIFKTPQPPSEKRSSFTYSYPSGQRDYKKEIEDEYDIDWDLWGISKLKSDDIHRSDSEESDCNYFDSFTARPVRSATPNMDSLFPKIA
ncbi:hypothetical protein AGDE_13328 [Angomonas deanei]|uniref:Uncharacterized protein n=1 Tax=Angomonas deanei TaxID=59799 RepID=A0A7G2CHC9_9TRYP|nr:hypothetical protein AGDE_13328 [Angomonas deanei]CAD2218314.1 hypothetical protein, conserved [Angomonas deanei]|eukprot:EPY22468.1 hypothetical protein AGDE_13328 [Angomonas deanei]